MDEKLESLVRTPEMADVDDLLRTESGLVSLGGGSSFQAHEVFSRTEVSSAFCTMAHDFDSEAPPSIPSDDRVDPVVNRSSSPPGDLSGNDSGGEESVADERVDGDQASEGATFLTEDSLKLAHGKFPSLTSWAAVRLSRILSSGRINWGDFSVERIRRSIPRITAASRVAALVPPPTAESSKKGRNADVGKRMGKVKRDIPVYTQVMSETPSILPSERSVKSGSPLVSTSPAVSSAALAVGSSTHGRSSAEKSGEGGDLLAADILKRDTPKADSPAAPSSSGALATVGPKAAEVSKQLPVGDSKKRKRMFAFDNSDGFLSTPEDCAQYLRSFRLPSSSLPDLGDMSFAQEYMEWASCEAQSKIRGNHLVGLFEGKCKRLLGDLEEKSHLLAKDEEKSLAISSSLKSAEDHSARLEIENGELRPEVDCLKQDAMEWGHREKELLSEKSVLEAEVVRLKESCLSWRCRRSAVLSPSCLLVLVVSWRSCLQLFIEEGIPIPAEKLAENERALRAHAEALDQMEIHDLEAGDLPSFSFDVDPTAD
ncbi:hypothetical protein Bca4012_058976 [Brassica carinata]